MGLPRSTYYDVPGIPVDDTEIVSRIHAVCDEFEAYGYRRVGAALRHQGIVVNSKKVRRLMREHDLQPRCRGRFVATTDIPRVLGSRRPGSDVSYPEALVDVTLMSSVASPQAPVTVTSVPSFSVAFLLVMSNRWKPSGLPSATRPLPLREPVGGGMHQRRGRLEPPPPVSGCEKLPWHGERLRINALRAPRVAICGVGVPRAGANVVATPNAQSHRVGADDLA